MANVGRHSPPRRALRGGVIGLVAAAVAFALPVELYERRTFDVRMRAFADSRRADPGIVAVVVDQKSIDAIAAPRAAGGLGQGWPWPRDYYAAVVRYLFDSGARAVAFDLLFSEESIYTQLGVAADDEELAAATSGKPVVHAAMLTREPTDSPGTLADRQWPDGLRELPPARRVDGVPADVFNKAKLPVPALRHASRFGWIGFEPDEDGTCRAVRLAAAYAPLGNREPVEIRSLPLALASVLGERVEWRPDGPTRTRLHVDGRAVSLDGNDRLLLRFHGGEGAYRQFSFAKVLESGKRALVGQPIEAARPEEFRGKVVFIGATAAGLLDLRATSIGAILPGYLIHATALDNLIHGDALRRLSAHWRAAVLLVLGVLCGALVAGIAALRGGALAALGLGVSYWALALWAFAARGVWLDLVAPTISLALAYGGATGYAFLTEGRERRFLRDAFSRYLAPEVVEELVADPGRLALGGETRNLTVMFADVAGFTSLSEGRPPQQVVELMNECFTELTGVIQAHRGTVDKFMGDAVMAFWNAPVEQPDHAARACAAARDLLEAVARLNTSWASRGLPAISMRVGLATGPAVVGNVGSRTKVNYTVMGDTVNLASRLEGAAKVYHTLSLVAGTTVDAAQGSVAFRELDWLVVKGRTEPVPVFEVLPRAPSTAQATAHRCFDEGLRAYRAGGFDKAIEHFEAALAADPGDGPSTEMLAQCHEYIVHPPSVEWRGARVLTTK
jgi:adenylate cyclase